MSYCSAPKLLLVAILLACTCAAASSAVMEDVSPKMARIQRHLGRLNKPALRTIQVG
jgi:hypothetical protein